ncbi:MAG: hypothetical protein KAS32_17985 [Candidatus Peribacteraceae bacterium]|nr:hypothetical protein [Candidatus Peribacteraceae bacterium]
MNKEVERQTDFPELEKLPVNLTVDGTEYDCITAGVNFDVGITLVDKKDNKIERICLNAKEHNIDTDGMWTKEIYTKLFYLIVEGIKSGNLNTAYTNSEVFGFAPRGQVAPCAFRQ